MSSTTKKIVSSKAAYWDAFYSERKGCSKVPRYPSQFAAFAVNEMGGTTAIIEFGCGNGRDSEFFAHYGLNVLAIDASQEAIELCQSNSESSKSTYVNQNVSDAGAKVAAFICSLGENPSVAVYARFFLHAITDEEQQNFFDMLARELPFGAHVFLEYRTVEDEAERKEFGIHYRRFLTHSQLLALLTERGFETIYEIESRGLAKYKQEDAMVGRCVARKL
jgi:tellurite methyltransferase